MMGSGKSSVGRALAARTGWPFLDNDQLVEQATGRTARALLAQEGEDALRAAESAALRAGLESDAPAIIGVAAGVVLDPTDRARLDRDGMVVWLRAAPEVLAARAVGGDHRPWLEADPVGWFRTAIAEREPLYAEVADVEIDTGTTSPAQAADLIMDALDAEGRASPIPSQS